MRSALEPSVTSTGTSRPTVEEILDTFAARSPDPFVVRVERRPGEREPRWAQIISAPDVHRRGHRARAGRPDVTATPVARAIRAAGPGDVDLARDVAELWARVERLERRLGLNEDVGWG